MTIQQIINKTSPSTIFLIDGLGAVLSAFMLGIVLVTFEKVFGMKYQTLYFLAAIAVVFSFFSLTCFFRKVANWRLFIKIIAIANLLYCCLTIGLIIYFYQQLTILGLLYFVIEIILVVTLSVFELQFSISKNDYSISETK